MHKFDSLSESLTVPALGVVLVAGEGAGTGHAHGVGQVGVEAARFAQNLGRQTNGITKQKRTNNMQISSSFFLGGVSNMKTYGQQRVETPFEIGVDRRRLAGDAELLDAVGGGGGVGGGVGAAGVAGVAADALRLRWEKRE